MAGGVIEYTAQSVEMLREQAINKALQLAIDQKVVTDATKAVVRDILPKTDLGADDEKFEQTLQTDGAYNEIYNQSMDNKKIIVFYGAIVPSGTITTALRFNKGGSRVIDIINLEKAKYTNNNTIIFDDPIIYDKSSTVKIDAYCPKGTTVPTTDNIVLLGVVVEAKGDTIDPESVE